jgi:hypothetical protein
MSERRETLEERREKLLQMAREAGEAAKQAEDPERRVQFLRLAELWREVAEKDPDWGMLRSRDF